MVSPPFSNVRRYCWRAWKKPSSPGNDVTVEGGCGSRYCRAGRQRILPQRSSRDEEAESIIHCTRRRRRSRALLISFILRVDSHISAAFSVIVLDTRKESEPFCLATVFLTIGDARRRVNLNLYRQLHVNPEPPEWPLPRQQRCCRSGRYLRG